MVADVAFPAVFADPTLEETFSRDGYVVTPLLDPDDVEQCRSLYFETIPGLTSDFFTTALMQDEAVRLKVREGLGKVTAPYVASLLPGYTTCVQHFVAKRGGPDTGFMPLHRDFNFVDHEVHRAVHVWIALGDVDEQNGCMRIVPKSHRLGFHINAMGSLSTPHDPYRHVLESDCSLAIPMRSGEALFFDERTLHGSFPNKSHELRLAMSAVFLPSGLKQRVYVRKHPGSTELDVLEVETETVLNYGASLLPPYPEGLNKIGTVEHAVMPYSSEAIAGLRRYPRIAGNPAAVSPSIDSIVTEHAKHGFFSRLFRQR